MGEIDDIVDVAVGIEDPKQLAKYLFDELGGMIGMADHFRPEGQKTRFYKDILPKLVQLGEKADDEKRKRTDGGKDLGELNTILARVEEYAAEEAPHRFEGERPVS